MILEAKAVAAISPVFIAQTIIYLKVLGNKLGVLINFGEAQMKVKRLVLQMGREQRMEPRMTRITRMTRMTSVATESATDARRGLFVDACESVALAGVARVEAFFEPVHSLFGGSVCECVWNYIAFALFLKPVVADGIGGIEGRL